MSLLIDVPAKYNAYKKIGVISANISAFFLNSLKKNFGWGVNNNLTLGDNTNLAKYSPVLIALYGLNKTFCKITSGYFHSAAIDKNGRAWAWGSSANGRLGDNSSGNKCYPVLVAGQVKTFCEISALGGHTLAIDKNGRAWAWGLNQHGQVGVNSIGDRSTPVSVLGAVKTFCAISAGDIHSLAIDKNGRAWAWGNNSQGRLGDNSTVSKLTPVSVLGAVKTFCKITAGGFHSAAIDKNGRAWCWGDNSIGQLGDNSLVTKTTPVSLLGAVKTFCAISAGEAHTLAIDKNGRAWGWGSGANGRIGDNSFTSRLTPVSVLGSVKTFCAIDAGAGFSVAIDKNGRVWAWGDNSNGQLGNNSRAICKITPVSIAGVVKTFCEISGGVTHTIAIDKNGRAWGWGQGASGQLGNNGGSQQNTPISVLGAVKTFCRISAGNSYSVAINKNGRAWAWGVNGFGQLGDNSSTGKFTPVSVLGAVKTFCAISAGDAHTLAIDKNGRAWGWGRNTAGRIGDNSIVNRLTPVSVQGNVKTFCKISAGGSFSFAIDKNGRAWAWAINNQGQLGDGTLISRLTPVSIAGAVKTFCEISAGGSHGAAIDKNGRVWGWGLAGSGQLALGGIVCVFTPVSITGATKTFCGISAGDGFSMALDKNGRAWAWGNNLGGNLGINSVTSQNSPVSVLGTVRTFCKITGGGVVNSSSFTLALDKNGRAWSWGYNGVGQLGNNAVTSQLTPVSILGAVKTFCEISNGVNQPFALAIDKNGTAWAWGVNGNGQLGNNTVISQRTPVSVLGAIKTFCKVSVGGFHSLAIDKNGRLWAWGNNSNGQLGNNQTANSILTPVSVLGAVKTFCHIAGGNSQSVAIDKNGQAWGWGFNSSGANGDGAASDNLTPVSVQGQKKTFCKIASGNGVSLSIDNYGRLWAWGFNGNAQIGDNSSIPKRTPTRVCNTRTFCEVKGANNHVLAIEKNGQVWAWGSNTNGQLAQYNIASVLTPVSIAGAVKTFCAISAGATHTIAIDKNGRAWGWGVDLNGQLGLNSRLFYITTPMSLYGNKTFCKIQINTGATFSTAIDYQGRVWSWGLNSNGQLGSNNFTFSETTPVRVCVI
jgi:alpha-tubulin suppressor-like RCC1 family protein